MPVDCRRHLKPVSLKIVTFREANKCAVDEANRGDKVDVPRPMLP